MSETQVQLRTPFNTGQSYTLKKTTTNEEVQAEFSLDSSSGVLTVSTEQSGHYNLYVKNYTGEYMYRLLIGEELNTGSIGYYLDGFQGGSGGISEAEVREIVQNQTSGLPSEETVREIVFEEVGKIPPATVEDEAIIRAIGYKTIVSNEEPASATYTLADGTVVPVIWQKPFELLVPVVPQVPVWLDQTKEIVVPDLVGIQYKIVELVQDDSSIEKDIVVTPETEFNVENALGVEPPYDIRIEAIPKPGYSLSGEFFWNHTYPDPSVGEIITSATFNEPDGWLGEETDAGLGGVPWPYTGTARLLLPDATERIRPFRIEDGKLKKTSPEELATYGGTFNDSWHALYMKDIGSNVRVEFDYELVSDVTAVNELFSLSIATFRDAGGSIVLSFRSNALTLTQQGTVHTGAPPNGRYLLERSGSTIRLEIPGKEPYFGTIDIDDNSTSVGKDVSFRDNYLKLPSSRPTLSYTIDNLVITRLGF